MKKLLLLIILLTSTICSQAQTYYKLHSGKSKAEVKYKSQLPTVSVHFQSVSYTQINLETSFFQITENNGVWTSSASTVQFTPSFLLGSANATVIATADGDTIYNTSQNLAYGFGITLSENVATGKVGTAPSLIFQVGSYAALAGYDVINKMPVFGLSFSLSDIPFINSLTNVKL